ncbi:MAG TPA: phosphate/phosphite/phosphonate ABC transporter substrate-binding protein [Candidatus Angelobacter sp.]|jgi:phosphonate transport system substrate-binding protein|nr:phosphate/phosphite/phosphonate ABC transporter substrate-binding protein [Candidatus Angelobacter sp.]
MILRIRTALFALVCVLALVSLAAAQKPIVVALSPDGLSAEERMPLQTYLTKQMGREVKFIIPNNYNEYLAGFADGTIDFASLGAVNYVRAHAKHGVIPLVQRPNDLEYHSVFITGAGSGINSLKDLKGKQFAFGDIYSTSGHVIPSLEMKRVGINQETDIKFRYTGGHPNTAKLVEAGVVDAGALDEVIYKSMIDGGKLDRTKVRIFYTSKPFVDYVYVARKEVPEAERTKFSKALEALRQGKDDQVLRILRAKQFIPANDQEYGAIRQMVKELNLLN